MRFRFAVLLGAVAVMSFLPATALAQGVGGGPKGGATFSTLSGEFADPDLASVTFEYKAGFALGGIPRSRSTTSRFRHCSSTHRPAAEGRLWRCSGDLRSPSSSGPRPKT